ncbi:hypothetical protein SUNI508_00164 [Seiridium unicorne]|uniref:Beta-glucuronidase C-terminal domain-containing protein n=1 Tax=Seiridium unicorne TaxID=138068 RepID=A0ABR2VI72_9PEZI
MRVLSAAIIGLERLAFGTLAQDVLQLSISTAVPEGASSPVDPSFAGFGIEPSNLFSYTGMEQPNTLTFNLIDNLASYTGKPPHIRLGGNTEDYMIYHEDMTQWTWINNPDPVGQGAFATDHMLIGPRFFEAANRFPKGTPVTWGLNLAYSEDDWADQITTMATQVIENCPNLTLASLEIGNEPDLYLENGFRSGTWNGRVYTQQWLERAAVLYERVLRPNNITNAFFEPAATASTIGTDFQIQDLMSYGIDVLANDSSTSYIASWNQHDYYYYIGVSTYALTLSHFLQLSTTEDQFHAWVEQLDQAGATPFPYALREMGVVGPIGLEGITNTFGAALWALNFLLYTAMLNITSVQLHMTDNSNASAWQPIDIYGRQPFVRPLYYSYAAFGQIIGPTCTAQIAAVDLGTQIPTGYDGYVRAYAVYQAGTWESMALINAMPSNTSAKDKPSVTVRVNTSTDLAGQKVHLSYLSNAGSDSTEGTTWNGLDFETSGDGTSTDIDDGLSGQTVQIADDGTVEFQVRDSQAVVAKLGHGAGAGLEPDQAACAAIAQRSPEPGGNASSSIAGTSGGDGSASGGSTTDSAGGGNNAESIANRKEFWLGGGRQNWIAVVVVAMFLGILYL